MTAKLQQLAGLAGNGIIPILDNLHYDGKGTFTASNQANTMSISGLDIGVKKELCVGAKDFVNILKALGDAKEVEIAADESTLTITSGRSKYKLPLDKAEDFPTIPTAPSTTTVTIPAAQLKGLINATLFAVSKDELRPAMCGIRFEKGNVVATDSHRMAICETDIDLEFILPASSARAILSAFPDDGDLTLSQSNKFVTIAHGDTTLIATKIDERYPDWSAVVPVSNPFKLTVNPATLSDALNRLLLTANNSAPVIVFDLGQECSISAQDVDFNKAGFEFLEGTYEGDPLRIGFNGRLMFESLRSLRDESVEIQLLSPQRAALAVAEGKKLLFMPMVVS